jgi:RNA polymerase sigma-70 factor (ECF subfamily)
MKGFNMTVEESVIAVIEESQHFYSLVVKGNSVVDSSGRRHLHSNGIIDHKESSDEELVRSFVETQDEGAFNEIVNRYGNKIYRTALRITRNPGDAEDVLQEVFITLIEKLNTFHKGSKFSTWLYGVAANASCAHLRAGKKIHDYEVSLEDYTSYNEYGVLEGIQMKDWSKLPDEVLLSKEVMEVIEGAVNELPVPYRVVFHLRDVEGLTNPEVAKVLDLHVTAVKSRFRRARLFLRDKLSDYFHEWRNNS